MSTTISRSGSERKPWVPYARVNVVYALAAASPTPPSRGVLFARRDDPSTFCAARLLRPVLIRSRRLDFIAPPATHDGWMLSRNAEGCYH